MRDTITRKLRCEAYITVEREDEKNFIVNIFDSNDADTNNYQVWATYDSNAGGWVRGKHLKFDVLSYMDTVHALRDIADWMEKHIKGKK